MFYFTSDIHFSDESTLKTDNRPFKNTKKFDKFMIKSINKQAKKDDVIYIIGDFIDCDGEGYDGWKKSILYIKKIKAPVILITGNNEDRVIKYYFDNNFDKFKKYCLSIGFKDVHKNSSVSFENKEFYLVHKPKDYKKGVLNLFGHMHRSGGLYKPFGFNIGCDLNHFRLYSETDILNMINMKEKYWDKDKNLNMEID